MKWWMGVSVGLSLMSTVSAASLTVNLYKTAPAGQQGISIGSVTAVDTQYGVLFVPHLHGLSPGVHGFHLHENPSCANAGQAAGAHWDPGKTGMHLGPYDPEGELGDLPALTANAEGKVTLSVLAPRLKVSALQGHALMIHADGDNYSDVPKPLGGGGARVACGVIASNALVTQNASVQDASTDSQVSTDAQQDAAGASGQASEGGVGSAEVPASTSD